MFKTKKEVDAHVRTSLSKVRSESERQLRSLTIAKLYFKINEYATAEQYLTSYLTVKQDNDQAHKLLGQCYQRLKKPDKALQAYQVSLQLNPKQSDVLSEVCQMLLDEQHLNTNQAKYWCELAESEKVQHEAVFSLRLKLLNKDNLGINQVEELLQKEILSRPNDVQLRVRLVRNYVEKNQILDAFKYVHQLEMSQKDDFVTSSEWYNIVWLVLNKYEKMSNIKKDWDFWLLVAMCLERQVQIAFTSTITSTVVGGGVTEIANLLFNFDQYLFKINQSADKFCAQKELVELFLEHYRGQLLLHAAAVIVKRELLQNKNKWKETTRSVLPLLLLAYQIKAPENKEPWMKHSDEQSKQLIGLWQKEGSFRCAQAGRIILSCINDDPSVDKENAHNINYLMGFQSNSSLWQSNDEVLGQIRQTCSDRQWRHNIFALLFCNSDQKVKEQSSLFAKSTKLSEPVYELPTYAEVEQYEDAAQYLRPQSLQHMVYLCLGNDNLAYVRAKYFSGLNFSTHNLSFCGAESLNQLDVDSFLYATTIQAKRALEVDREAFDSYQSGNNSAAGKPRILPFVNLLNILCSEEQAQWWNVAYLVYKNLTNGNNLAELRATLQYGIEAVRGVNGPKSDMAIVFKLGQLFVARAQDIVKPIEKNLLEARAESIYKYGLNMLKMHNKGVLEPFRKYFVYYKSQTSAAERELSSAAEDAVSYLATRYFKKSEYEDLIEELSGLQLPFATYLQAEAYRKLDEASKTPKKTKRMYLDRASECLNQTLALLKSSAHADPNHPLNSVIHSEIKRLQQSSARYINDPNINFTPMSGHNNSSTYEDAEADLHAENSFSHLNSSRNRRETLTNVNSLIATQNLEMEHLTKQLTDTLKLELNHVTKEVAAVSEKMSDFDKLKLELGNVTKEITALKEKVSSFEDIIRKIRVSSNPPSRDDASNMLDDLYLIEDTLQQQLYQQQQQPSNTAPHMPNQQYGNNANSPFLAQQQRLQAAAFNAPMFPPTHNFPMNFYGHPNQPNAYIMAPPPPVPAMSQRAVPGMPALPPYLDPTVPVPPAAALNFSRPATSTPLLPPPQPTAAVVVPQPQTPLVGDVQNKSSNLYNLLQQITPTISNQQQVSTPHISNFSNSSLTHTSMATTAPHANNTANIQIPKPLNSQQMEKVPPANVVITSSDPLPNPNTIASQAQHQTPLSVTIPSHHIKPSLVSQPPNEMAAGANNKSIPSSVPPPAVATTFSNTFGGAPFATSTFSFKPQIAAAAAANSNTASESLNKTSDSIGSDFNRSATDVDEYDPRPDFKAIIPLPDEIEVRTGEEDEEVMFCQRAKLFRHVDKEWKERGIGDIKILKNKAGSSRILMRRDQTHKICANHVITPELILTVPKNETKGFIWVANDFADESLHVEKFFVRFKLPETALQFQEAFKNAQEEAKNKTSTKEEQTSKPATAFSLAKSNTTNFATSTPAQKNETGLEANTKASTVSSSTSATTTSNAPASKSLFGGLNLTTKTASVTETSNKPVSSANTAAGPSPFANFSFGKSVDAAATTQTTSANVTKATTTSSPFASIFSNLSNSPFANTAANANATPSAFTPTTIQETAVNKSVTSDTEDDYVPTAQFSPVIPLPDLVEVNTGEENELVLFEHYAELLRYDKQEREWKERGLGKIKLLQDKEDTQKVRLVMRREKIHKLCCNQRVYKHTSFKYAKKSKTELIWGGQDFSENELVLEIFAVRFEHPETCQQFLETIQQAQSKMTSEAKGANSKESDNKAEPDKNENGKGFGDAFKPKAGSWSCEACYISNEAQQKYCVACNAPKDSTVPKKETTSSGLATSSANKFNFGFSNSQPQTSVADSTKTGFGDAFKPKAGSWNCQSCYLSNTSEALYCKACDAPKDNTVPKKEVTSSVLAPSNPEQRFSFGFGTGAVTSTTSNEVKATASTPAPAVGFGDAFKPKAGSWTCQACYLSNAGDLVYCTACDAPKDDTVPKKEAANTNILALSNPAQKFNFGFGSTTNDSSKTVSGFAFNSAHLATTDSSKSFSFTPPSATSTTLPTTQSFNVNANEPPEAAITATSAAIGKTTFTFKLASKAMEAPALPGGGGESTANAFSLDKKEFSFNLKPKSPGKTDKNLLPFGGGGGGDADAAGDGDDGEADLHEEEENNTYFTPVIPLPDKINVVTGEEDEDILYVHRAKLYRFADGEWKERGLGDVKILRHKENKKLRVVMRREQLLKICLNHILNEDVDYKRKDDKSWCFVVNDFSEGAVELEKFSLRFKTKEIAEKFMEAINKALDGTAKKLEGGETNSTLIRQNIGAQVPPSANAELAISDKDKKTADKLKLPYEFFTAKPTCTGCRGCDSDKFEFTSKNIEPFINKEDTENQLLTMELPTLTLRKSYANRSLLKQSTLSPANLKTETKANESIFSGFGGANSTGFTSCNTTAITDNKPANTTFSFTAALNNTTTPTVGDSIKPFGAAGSGGFLFGSSTPPTTTTNTNIFGGGAGEKKSIFGAKPVKFEGGFATDSSSNNAITKTNDSANTTTTSIFGHNSTSGGQIFGEKTLFGSGTSAFGSSSSASDSGKPLFGNLANNTTQSAGGKSIFGSTSSSGFRALGANNSQTSIFGSTYQSAPQFGSLTKDAADTSTPMQAANAAFADTIKSENESVDFASLAKSNTSDEKAPLEFSLSKSSAALIGFDDLAKAANSNISDGKPTDKPVFGALGANNTQTSIFGSGHPSAPQFDSLAKNTADTTTPMQAANTTFADVLKTGKESVDFASLAKSSTTTEYNLSNTAAASIGFADLAKTDISNIGVVKPTDKPGLGGFIGLTHTDFSSFEKPQGSQKSKSSAAGETGSEENDDNYDPHYEPIIQLPNEIEIRTGEEEETKLFGEHAKLFRWDATNKAWKERGVGELKILSHPAKQSYRMILRRNQIHKLVLNYPINENFVINNIKDNPNSYVWAGLNFAESEEGELEKLAIRFSNTDLSNAFRQKLAECIDICKQRTTT